MWLYQNLAFICFTGKEIAEGLNSVDAYDQDDNSRQHDVRTEPLVAVTNGNVPQTAAADGTGHGGRTDKADDKNRNVVDNSRQCFG